MTLDSTLRPLAVSAYERFGKQVTLRHEEQGAFDPVTGTYGDPVITDYDVWAAPPASYRQDYIDGTLVQQQDLRISIAAEGLSIEPSTGTETTNDTLLIDGTEYSIVSVHPVYAGAMIAMFTLQVRV